MFDIDIRFLLFELLTIFLFGFCLFHASKRKLDGMPKGWYVIELLSAFLFGMILEWIGVNVFLTYHYGHFFLTFEGVPICVGMFWAFILYSSMLTSDCWNLPPRIRPLTDLLQVLNFDLSADVIAIRVGFWNWDMVPQPLMWSADWFGVPYENFFGWIFITFSFSCLTRAMRSIIKNQSNGRGHITFIALPVIIGLSLLTLYTLLIPILVIIQPLKLVFAAVIVILSVSFLTVIFATFFRDHSPNKPEKISFLIPLIWHAFFLILLFTPNTNSSLYIVLIAFSTISLRLLFDYFLFRPIVIKKFVRVR